MPSLFAASLLDATPRNAKRLCCIRTARLPHAQQGAAAVEFALILPILLLVFFGIAELSLALYNKAILTNASREGARAGIVLSSPKMNDAQISAVVLNYTNGALISLGAATAPTVTVVQSSPAGFPNPLRVTVSYTYKGLGVGTMLGALGAPIVLTGSTSMVNE